MNITVTTLYNQVTILHVYNHLKQHCLRSSLHKMKRTKLHNFTTITVYMLIKICATKSSFVQCNGHPYCNTSAISCSLLCITGKKLIYVYVKALLSFYYLICNMNYR